MYRLIYQSFETQSFSEEDLKRLLLGSRLRNTAESLTGMLVYDGGTFLQLLEGEEVAVRARFERIQSDLRHKDVSVIVEDATSVKRTFGQWSMGFSDGSDTAAILRGFVHLPNGLRAVSLDAEKAVNIFDALVLKTAA